MNVLAPIKDTKFHGGGSTFTQNLKKALGAFGDTLVSEGDYDIFFIPGATLIEREAVLEAKKQGKPIVLRVDNILEDRKNRNAGMSKLRDYAELADVIVYQSEWAKKMLSPLLGNGMVIYNGVDTDIFTPRKEKKNWENLRIFYSKYSRNEVKQFHEVQYWWREYNLKRRDDTLVLVGRFADDYLKIAHPFDFHNEEEYEYIGVVSDPKDLARVMQSCDIAFLPYMYDACSNTILEAQACGLPVIYSPTGGTPEIVVCGEPVNHQLPPEVQVSGLSQEEFDPTDPEGAFRYNFSLERMGEKYHSLFITLTSKSFDV